jgi:hypothetical protein
MRRNKMSYVLFIEFADDPPRVAVFNTFDEAECCLDVFQVEMFDPPRNDALHELPFRARIFKCDEDGWGTEIDIRAAREKITGKPLPSKTDIVFVDFALANKN